MDIKPNSERNDERIKIEKNKTPIYLNPRILLPALITVVAIGLLIGSYALGYRQGHRAGVAISKDNDSSSKLFENLQNPFPSVTGKVANISQKEITIDTVKGKKETLKLTDKTRVTKKTETINIKDINKDQEVTAFTSGEGDKRIVTRIVLRD